MFNRPLVLVLFLWVGGIVLAFNFLPASLPFIIITFLFLLPFTFIHHPLAKAFLIFAFFPLSIAWNSAYFFRSQSYSSCEGRGIVVGEVVEEANFSGDRAVDFLVRGDVMEMNGVKDKGKMIRVFLSKKEVDLKMGQRVKLAGEISIPSLRTRLKGISYHLRSAKLIAVEEGRGFKALLGRLRHLLSETSERLLPRECSLILTNLLIGKAGSPVPSGIVEAFRKTGTIHILVVSGTQVSLLVALIWFLLRLLNIGAKRGTLAILFLPEEVRRKMGLSPKGEVFLFSRGVLFFLFFSFLIFGYAYLAGGELPIHRAAVMGILGVIAVILAKEMDTFNIFAFTCLFLLISYPPALYSVSFQLSFLAVWGLIVVLPIVKVLLPSPRSPFLRFPYLLFTTSLAAQVAVAPLLIYHFKMVSPIALIANVLAVPISFVILIEGLCLLPLVFLAPFLEGIIAPLLNIPISTLLHTVYFFSRLPLASLEIYLPPFLVYFLLFLLFLAGEMVAQPSPLKKKSFLFSFSLFTFLLVGHNLF